MVERSGAGVGDRGPEFIKLWATHILVPKTEYDSIRDSGGWCAGCGKRLGGETEHTVLECLQELCLKDHEHHREEDD